MGFFYAIGASMIVFTVAAPPLLMLLASLREKRAKREAEAAAGAVGEGSKVPEASHE